MGAGQPEQRDGAPTSDPGAAEDDAAPRVRVLAPHADEVLRGGTRLRIEWESTDNVAVVGHRVQLSVDGGKTYREIAELPGAAQSCVWTLPAVGAERARIKVVARDAAGNLGMAQSAGFFTIEDGDRAAPVVTLLEPRVGTLLRGGDTVTVRWVSRDDVGVTRHTVQLSLDGGRSYNTLVEELKGDCASLAWLVPNLTTTLARLRVQALDAAGNLGVDEHDGAFTIEAHTERPRLLGA